MRRIAIFAAVLAALIGGISGTAFASAGCDSVNTGGFTASTGAISEITIANFAVGDGVTFTITRVTVFPQQWRLQSGNNTTLDSSLSATSEIRSYTVTGNNQDTTLKQHLSGGGLGTISTTATCTAAAGGSTGTPTNSQNAVALQNSITKLVATTSGAVISGAIDGGIADGFSNGGTPTSFGPNGGFINFAAEPKSEIASRADEAFSAFGYAGGINKAPNYNKAPPRLDRDWSAWADIRGTGWKLNDTSGTGNDLKGDQINITAGIGRKLTPDTLVGVVGGYEHFKYDVAALAGSLKGDGETIGGYFAQRFGNNLRFDAAVAWSNVNYSVTAGTATGSFTGSRWLASTGLTGNYKVNVYVVEPSAKVYMLWESEKAWTDSLGTLQPSRDFSAGRTALGAKVARPFEVSNGWTLSPYAGFYGDWRFQTDSALPTATPVANIGTGWSGRVTGGVSATALRGGTVSLGGEYGGLGASYKIWTGNVRASMPF